MTVSTYEVSAEALSIATLEIVNALVSHLVNRGAMTKDEFAELLKASAKRQQEIAPFSAENEEAAKLLDQFARAEAGLWLTILSGSSAEKLKARM